MTSLQSDAQLARRATAGDQRAFAAIFRRYHQALYRFCLSILHRPEDAQEALQGTMVKALRSLPGEEREIQLKPWLYRVAHNESVGLLRRRRDGVQLEAVPLTGQGEIAETAAMRERLGRLLLDLEQIPEQQRSALVMRELGGLDYEQIGTALEISSGAARQTVYEARLSLRELETGHEMRCGEVTRQLSAGDGRALRRRNLQSHLRGCTECRDFRDSIKSRQDDLAALAPLPAVASAALLNSLVGGQAAGGALAGGATGAAAGKTAASSLALKAVATVAVLATVGVTAADRGGLIDAGLPGGGGGNASGSAAHAVSLPRDAAGGATLPATGGPGGLRSELGVGTRPGGVPLVRHGIDRARQIARGDRVPTPPPPHLPDLRTEAAAGPPRDPAQKRRD